MLLDIKRLKILEEFLENYDKKLIGSIIAKKKNLNQKSVSNILNELEDLNLLKSKTEGKNKCYFLNFDNIILLIQFLSMLEHFRTLEFYKKNSLIKEIASKILNSCEGIVILFGSYAKGLAKKESDLDLFIIGKYDKRLIEEVSDLYGLEINVQNYSFEIFTESLKKTNFLLNEVFKQHILLKGSEDFISRRFLHETNRLVP